MLGNSPGNVLLEWDRDSKAVELAFNPPANDPARVPLLAWSGLQCRSDFHAIVSERFHAKYLGLAKDV